MANGKDGLDCGLNVDRTESCSDLIVLTGKYHFLRAEILETGKGHTSIEGIAANNRKKPLRKDKKMVSLRRFHRRHHNFSSFYLSVMRSEEGRLRVSFRTVAALLASAYRPNSHKAT